MHPLTQTFIFVVLSLGPPLTSHADPDFDTVLRALEGRWTGELFYLDYRSGERFGIPMSVAAELTTDGATLVRRITWTDPGREVHAVNLVAIDADNGKLVEAFFREGSGEHSEWDIEEVTVRDQQHWTLVYGGEGSDDNRPARLRHTVERDGARLTSRKHVRFDVNGADGDAGGDGWIERNGAVLALAKTAIAPADTAALLGSWDVQLFHAADEPPSRTRMVISGIAEGILSGTFYGTEFSEARVTAFGEWIIFSAVTADNSGRYLHSGRLRDGWIEGQTFSVGRQFLMPWRAQPVDAGSVADPGDFSGTD